MFHMAKGLIDEIILATELPSDGLRQEMERLFSQNGVDLHTDDIEMIRIVLAKYLQETIVEAKKGAGQL